MTSASRILRTATAFALCGFVAGGVHAAFVIFPREWVLEFQAGAASTTGEKARAVAQSAALEGLGFGAVGLVLGAIALVLARILPRWRTDAASQAFLAALLAATSAFFGWVNLAWLAEDALDFLTRGEVLLLDLAGFATLLAALLVFDAIAGKLPWAPRGAPFARVLASALCASLASAAGLAVSKGGGWREPARLALAAACFAAALPAAALLARSLAAVPLAGAAHLARRFPARPVTLVLGAALLACVVVAARDFQLSPLEGEARYATLPARAPAEPAPAARRPNVVFVTVDTLRADHLSCYGYPRPTSPFLDTIAAEGTRFADASAPAAWTKPSTGTILTGLYPSRHGALYHGSLLNVPEGERTLAEAFQHAGYVSAGFVSNPNVKRVFAFDRGFDEFFDSPVEDTLTLACIRGTFFGRCLMQLLRHQFNWNYENDIAQMNRHVLAWLEQNHEQPFFLYVHYIDPHIPYDPPESYRRAFAQDHGFPLFNERKKKVGIDLYDGEIRYTDDGLKELVGALERLGIWDDTLFVLTSDHGEEFFEHGVIGHGFSLYQEVLGVPLIVRGPGVPARVVEQPVAIVDLAATVLALAGIPVERFGDGIPFTDLIAADPGPVAPRFLENEFGQDDSNQREFVLSGVRSGPWKFVLTEENSFFPPTDPRYGREALYDLASDPDERRNLIQEDEHRALVQDLLTRLQEHSRFLLEQGFRGVAPAALTPDIEASLKALGYF